MTPESPLLTDLLAYWNNKRPDGQPGERAGERTGERAGGRLPARGDVDPLEIPGLLPNLLLIDVGQEPETPSLIVRLAGTLIVERYGEDYTGRDLREINFGDQRERVIADFEACIASAAPHLAKRHFWNTAGVHLSMERLILPLASDGQTVDKLMAGLSFTALDD